ncbi:MAG: hypothetical protein Q8M11_12930 [Sulfuritalea sp.]|nr:hypothetical protein [Sulfuritalea sp.]
MGIEVAGFDRDHASIAGLGFDKAGLQPEQIAQVVERLEVARVGADGTAIAGFGVRRQLPFHGDVAQLEVGLGMAWIEFQYLPVTFLGQVQPAAFEMRRSFLCPRLRGLRLLAHFWRVGR